MAGKRIVTPGEIEIAAGILAEKEQMIMSKGEGGSLTLMPGDYIIRPDNGQFSMSYPPEKSDEGKALESEMRAILMDMSQEVTKGPNLAVSTPRNNGPDMKKKANGGPVVRSLVPVRDIQVQDLTLQDIKEFICSDATDQEAYMFLQLCKARNLNPFTREAYLVKYGGKANMIVGKEAFTRKAEQNDQFDGFKAGIVLSTGEQIEGSLLTEGQTLIGGWAEVYRKDRKVPFKAVVALKEYTKGQATWKDMPATMIRKVALVSALREAFPSDLAGCYSSDELGIDPEKEVAGAQ